MNRCCNLQRFFYVHQSCICIIFRVYFLGVGHGKRSRGPNYFALCFEDLMFLGLYLCFESVGYGKDCRGPNVPNVPVGPNSI